MNKAELAAKVQELMLEKGIVHNRVDSSTIIDCFTQAVIDNVSDGKIGIVGFGTFDVIDVSEKSCINPATKEVMIAPAHKRVKFIPSKYFKGKVNGEYDG